MRIRSMIPKLMRAFTNDILPKKSDSIFKAEEDQAKAIENLKKFKIFDYVGVKYSYEQLRNTNEMTPEELFGLYNNFSDTKQERKEKIKDWMTVITLLSVYLFFVINYIVPIYDGQLGSFSDRISRTMSDTHKQQLFEQKK